MAKKAKHEAPDEAISHLIVAEDADVKVEYYPEDWLAMLIFWALVTP